MNTSKKNHIYNNNINGWLSLYKPEGITSAKAVSIVKRALNVKKVGHAGTLDPLACGVLPLAIGEATKTVSYAIMSEKTYRFIIKWGEETTTDDREGDIIAISDIRPSKSEITSIIPEFIGKIEQTPPAYSAIKVNGKRAYELARKGKDVKLDSRIIEIYDLKLEWAKDNQAQFITNCGKGTYIRSLAKDIAHKLGTTGHVTFLERCSVGRFVKESSILLEKCEKNLYKAVSLREGLMPTHIVLDDIPVLYVDSEDEKNIRYGKSINVTHNEEGPVSIMIGERLIAIGECQINEGQATIFKSSRVFNI